MTGTSQHRAGAGVFFSFVFEILENKDNNTSSTCTTSTIDRPRVNVETMPCLRYLFFSFVLLFKTAQPFFGAHSVSRVSCLGTLAVCSP